MGDLDFLREQIDLHVCSGYGTEGEVLAQSPRAWGAVFFHGQDVERGVRGEGLYLAFGAFATGPAHQAETVKVGREICDTLTRFGLPTEWNGTTTSRIRVSPFEWRKRRVSRPPSERRS
ncbi:MAG: hypothetical protein H6721_07660 [Sandaracinus sp.]|nr:hypothetical protein [Sandaracinus sp.]MCB9617824.1 hypothetical protein [Sandaracinus sp.]MCB9631996.1 hypothetical protein [Sandaracinus sp.]